MSHLATASRRIRCGSSPRATPTVRTQQVRTGAEQERNYLQHEHSTEPVARVFEFPADIDTDNVQVTLRSRRAYASSRSTSLLCSRDSGRRRYSSRSGVREIRSHWERSAASGGNGGAGDLSGAGPGEIIALNNPRA